MTPHTAPIAVNDPHRRQRPAGDTHPTDPDAPGGHHARHLLLGRQHIAHVHPELGISPPALVTPGNLAALMGHLKAAILNLDSETLKIEPVNLF